MASLANFIPFLRYKANPSRTWATTGNTDTVTDPDVHTNSIIHIQNISVPVGRWGLTVTEGQFVVTSSDIEPNTTTYTYLIE